MKKIFKYLMAVVMIVSFVSCRKDTVLPSSAAHASFETTGIGSELDGSVTVRAWGKGKDKADALDQARKQAVYDVVFNGIKKGEGTYNGRPLIFEVNAKEKYEYYFNRLFADNGEFEKYATFADENRKARMVAKNKGIENWSTIIRVERAKLKEKLIEDGIIKP